MWIFWEIVQVVYLPWESFLAKLKLVQFFGVTNVIKK